ncbi:hypothetical protein GUJ93_ZPchr0010g8549 [Zizania palustris]|uniref:Uncharacterized protein n=1 Tax=Zizania palustris TaxID=103762 RepID=A0A8J6BN35_ZIZPA|nr:hypothetical protein GUJ93_ZPchr0010g8549 [Zizania palustris]
MKPACKRGVRLCLESRGWKIFSSRHSTTTSPDDHYTSNREWRAKSMMNLTRISDLRHSEKMYHLLHIMEKNRQMLLEIYFQCERDVSYLTSNLLRTLLLSARSHPDTPMVFK